MSVLDYLLSLKIDVPKLIELHSIYDELLAVNSGEAKNKLLKVYAIEEFALFAVVKKTVVSGSRLGDENNGVIVCW